MNNLREKGASGHARVPFKPLHLPLSVVHFETERQPAQPARLSSPPLSSPNSLLQRRRRRLLLLWLLLPIQCTTSQGFVVVDDFRG